MVHLKTLKTWRRLNMWHKHLENNYFLSKLYDEVPEIINTEILHIQINHEGDKLTILFMMPKYADNPPEKWNSSSYNSVIVELDFHEVEELSLTYNGKEFMSGDIKIESNDNGLLDVSISGTVDLTFKAYSGYIQSLKGVIVETLE